MIICIDARTVHPHFPGVGRYTLNLTRAVAAHLDASERLIVLRDPGGWLPSDAIGRGDRAELVDVALSPFALRQQWVIPRLLHRLSVDVYHSPYYLMPFRPAVPSVLTVHDLIPLRYPRFFTPTQRLVFAASLRLAVRAARIVIAPSAATARDLGQFLRLPAERIAVIPEAADPIFHPRPLEAAGALRARLGLPDGYGLYVGSNKPHKNLVRLVDAWGRLQPQPMPLVIAGLWDPRYPQARRHAEELRLGQAVRFLGPMHADDLAVLYGGARMVVVPSEYEGFGLPVVEAMASGVPVACSRAGSLPEVAGDAALLFDPLDVAAMAEAMGRLLNDARLRAELTRAGLGRAAQLSWQQAGRATLSVYRRLPARDAA